MLTTYSEFLSENPPCNKFAKDSHAQAIFELLSQEKSICDMIDASSSNAGKSVIPALAAVVSKIEEYIDNQSVTNFDLSNSFNRTVVGRMIKSVLAPFGYVINVQRRLPKDCMSKYFTSAMCYQIADDRTMQINPPTMRMVTTRSIEPIL